MKKYDEFIKESNDDDYSIDEKNAVLSMFNRALKSFAKKDLKFDGESKPSISYYKDKDLAQVGGMNIRVNSGYSKDFDGIIKGAEEVIHNIKMIKEWNAENKDSLIKLEITGDPKTGAVLFGGPHLYLVGKMSELLETEEAQNFLNSSKGVNKFDL